MFATRRKEGRDRGKIGRSKEGTEEKKEERNEGGRQEKEKRKRKGERKGTIVSLRIQRCKRDAKANNYF
jgi:hypothetical protein